MLNSILPTSAVILILSILYLRCASLSAIAHEMREMALSILYLRCNLMHISSPLA